MGMKIVSDNNYVVGSIGHLGMLLDLAVCRAERLGVPFKREEYKWALGEKVLQEIETNNVIAEIPNRSRMLFGVVVETDYTNPNNIQLWENITNQAYQLEYENPNSVLTIPDNPTNGQIQLVLYPELEVRDFGSFVEAHSPNVELRVSKSWWNAPFKYIDKNAYADKQGLEFADMPVLRSAT